MSGKAESQSPEQWRKEALCCPGHKQKQIGPEVGLRDDGNKNKAQASQKCRSSKQSASRRDTVRDPASRTLQQQRTEASCRCCKSDCAITPALFPQYHVQHRHHHAHHLCLEEIGGI